MSEAGKQETESKEPKERLMSVAPSKPAQAVEEAAKTGPKPDARMQCRVLVPMFTLRGQAYRAGAVVAVTEAELAEHGAVCRM